jgi:hypothetical protein
VKRLLSSPFFLVALLAFFLPFFSVQCIAGDQLGDLSELGIEEQELQLPEVTGVQLVTGDAEEEFESAAQNPPVPEIPGAETPLPTPEPQAQEVDLGTVQILAIAAAAVALLGLLLSLLAGRAGGTVSLLLGVAGAVVLYLTFIQFRSAVLGEAAGELEGVIRVEQELGFWLSLGMFGLAAAGGLVRILLPDRARVVGAPAAGTATGFGPPPPATPPPATPPPATPPPATPPPATPPPATPPPSSPPPSAPPAPPPEERPPSQAPPA